ncbi:hypothetical protein PPYR_03223 [Photinus pyralis]|uniref:Peptidase S1 domain-containing protein n=1 Tax=Photinus pyralis TaxID=7054 RepID=A0A1Y1LWY0_PHOPY|nr:trypsin delta/gamma-like protein CG30031 [Photinus pyralis]KAB0791423.1 hypothetical protein PPYR_03223 [Photinus pyralis]
MFLLLGLSLVCVAAACDLSQRIIGGNKVLIEQFPYQVALEVNDFQFCGGSIIASNKILTAAHCVEKVRRSQLRVRAGSSFRGKGGRLMRVESIHMHPFYDNNTYHNDVSVLTLAGHLQFGPTMAPIRLAPQGAYIPPLGAGGLITGWGTLAKAGKIPKQLQAAIVYSLPNPICQDMYRHKDRPVTSAMICFAYPGGGKDACQGDSGGPLVYNGVQIGVISWGINCGDPQFPGVFSRISALRNYIDYHAYYQNIFPYQLTNW